MSIIRPVSRPRPRRILIALAATITAMALLPTAAGAGGTTTHHLVFRLSGPARQDVISSGAVRIEAHCPADACTVVASAISKSPSIRTAEVQAHVPAGATESISVPFASRDRGKLKAAFEAGHRPTLTVEASARDAAGDHIDLSITVRPARP
jgi:hypothetical protein